MSELRDIRISGSGSVVGGHYNDVKISGSGTINGDLSCKQFAASGSAKVDGMIDAEFFRVSGSASFYGDVNAHEFKVSGSANFSGNVSGRDMRISGGVKVKQNLNGENIRISGGVSIGGDCEGEEIKVSGGIKVEGLINAGDLEIKINGNSYAREIGGESIKITAVENRKGGFVSKLLNGPLGREKYFKCESIEGDTIYLENTICKIVRGKNIIIGEGCQIDKIEYTGTMETKDDGEVKDIVKL